MIPFHLIVTCTLGAQAPEPVQPQQPDVLVFHNGEKLIGQLLRSQESSVVFHSDSIGDVTVEWSKIEEIHSSRKFAVIEKDKRLRKDEVSNVPIGTISVNRDEVQIDEVSGLTRAIPLSETNRIIDEQTFERSVIRDPGFREDWKGSLTGGVSLVQATQKNQTYTGAVGLIRAVPLESWLNLRRRTMFNFNATYGNLTQPDAPKLKTEIMHADFEHDIYFSRRMFGFGQATFDHNFSQGLDLSHTYGLGIGWTVVKRENQQLDLKVGANYVNQRFTDGSLNQNLIGSAFAQTYTRKMGANHDILLIQQLTITPTWNNLNAYSGTSSTSLNFPIYKRVTFTISLSDTFINNPPPGFRKNSFQGTTGLTYTLP